MLPVRSVALGIGLVGLLNLAGVAQVSTSRADTQPVTSQGNADMGDSDQAQSLPAKPASVPDPAQEDSTYEFTPGADPENHLISPFVKHLAEDQHTFWTAPAHFRVKDLQWAVPFVGATAGFMAGDRWISKQIPLSKVQTSKTFSDYGAYS